MAKSKKGISPLIATVLIIGFTVALAASVALHRASRRRGAIARLHRARGKAGTRSREYQHHAVGAKSLVAADSQPAGRRSLLRVLPALHTATRAS